MLCLSNHQGRLEQEPEPCHRAQRTQSRMQILPIFVPEETAYQEIIQRLHLQYCRSDTPVVHSLSHRTQENYDSVTATNRQFQTSETQTNFPVVATDAGTAETSRQAIGVRGVLGRGNDPEAASTREGFAPMKQESNRIASFDASWPRQDTPDPRDLARAGFYYTGTVDRVQCVFCRGILRNWDEDDVPMEEHRRHFPMCPFVMGLDVGNIPDPAAVIAANKTEDCLSVTQPSAVVTDASLGIVTERPKHCQYAVEAARITSFRNWPSGKEQTPQMLAKAGFYYAGFGDSVKCFFCGGGLRTWERGDIPWTEHARWYPLCPYVRQVKGEEFIQAALQGREPSAGESTGSRTDERSTTESIHGDDFPSVEALTDAIFQLSEEASKPTRASTSDGSLTRSHDRVFGETSDLIGAKGKDTEDVVMSADNNEAQSLVKENEQLKEQRRCKICMDADVTVVFLPCGHLVCCVSCAPALRNCPICRSVIRGTVRTYMS